MQCSDAPQSCSVTDRLARDLQGHLETLATNHIQAFANLQAQPLYRSGYIPKGVLVLHWLCFVDIELYDNLLDFTIFQYC